MLSCPKDMFTYQLKPGDTLYQLALTYNTTVRILLTANPGIDPHYLHVGQTLCIPRNPMRPPHTSDPMLPVTSMAESKLRNTWRALWADHTAWTRMAIQSNVFDTPDRSNAATRLIRNAFDMGNAMRPFYGAQNAASFGGFMQEHLQLADELVTQAKAKNTTTAAETEQKWYKNADDIAAFLSRLNPHWSVEGWKTMLYRHLGLVKEEVLAFLNGDYNRAVELYDTLISQAYTMADEFSAGIIKQFPKMF